MKRILCWKHDIVHMMHSLFEIYTAYSKHWDSTDDRDAFTHIVILLWVNFETILLFFLMNGLWDKIQVNTITISMEFLKQNQTKLIYQIKVSSNIIYIFKRLNLFVNNLPTVCDWVEN